MTNPVQSSNRFNRPSHPCPVCRGWERGNPQCKGYEGEGEAENFIFCTNSDYGGMAYKNASGTAYVHKKSGPCKCGTTHDFTYQFPRTNNNTSKVVNMQTFKPTVAEETYDYGDNCFVDRILTGGTKDGKPEKTFQQYQIVEGKKVFKGFKKLYRIDEVKQSDPKLPVVVAEGERKVNKLWEMGFVATCNVGGSAGWQDFYADDLLERTVLIWPDNDAAGAKFAEVVGESLKKKNVRWFVMNKLTVGLPPKGDVMDWVKIPGNDAIRLQAVIDEHLNAAYFEVLTYEDLRSLPKPSWLIEPFLVEGYVACLFGPTQTAKSFWAIDICMQLCHQDKQVLYLAGENSAGYGLRLDAWHTHFNKPRTTNFKLIRRPVNFLQPDTVKKLLDTINHQYRDLPNPSLIVVDTLSKSYQGGDENDSKDMREFLAACELLRNTYKCTVLVVHHSPKAGGTPRGSGVILGDFDTIIEANKVTSPDPNSKKVVYTCYKQKDAPEFKPITYAVVELGQHTIEASCVLEKLDDDTGSVPTGPTIDPDRIAILEVLNMELFSNGITHSTLMGQLNIPYKTEPKSKSVFNRHLEALLKDRYIVKNEAVKGRPAYTITLSGKDILGPVDFGF